MTGAAVKFPSNTLGTGEVRTLPASHPPRDARQGSWKNEEEPDAYGSPRSRCPEASWSNEE